MTEHSARSILRRTAVVTVAVGAILMTVALVSRFGVGSTMGQGMQTNTYRCMTCDELHEGPPLSYVSPAPLMYFTVPEKKRAVRCLLSSDLCVIDDKFFFILGNISLPIVGEEDSFVWTAWASLSKANFDRVVEVWQVEGRESEPRCFGWLSTALAGYPDTINLKTYVYTQPIGIRPRIELEPNEHPLAVEQRTGITRERIHEIAALILHGDGR